MTSFFGAKTMKTKSKIQKPTDIDASFKYRCPNCSLDHWLFLREAKTKNYKVVCECGCVFRPKTISKLLIVYSNKKEKSESMPVDTLNQCVKNLCDLGFDRSQSVELLKLAYKTTHLTDIGSLVKEAIKLFGDNKNV